MNILRKNILEKIIIDLSKDISPFNVTSQNLIRSVFGMKLSNPFIPHISLMPLECILSLRATPSLTIDQKDEKEAILLGLGHLSGWIGYTVIDGILDDQQKERLLPLATFLIRNMHEYIKTYSTEISQKILLNILKNTDRYYYRPTTSWKVTDISRRSLGHSIPAIIIASKNGYDGKDLDMIVEYFKYYLASRQLADDARDWKEDIIGKRDTGVTLLLNKKLSEAKIERIREDKIDHKLEKKVSSIVIDRVSPLMIKWTKKALSILAQSPYKNSEYFEKQIIDLQKQAIGALESVKTTD